MVLLERSAMLADLDNALATGSGGRVALIAGEAGIGKSALVRQFIRRREDEVRFLVGLCDPLLTPRALGPLRDIAGQAGGPLADRLAAGAAREEVFAALLDELAGSPQVIVVEDAQWADEATLDLLVMLGRRLERLPVLLVVTYRDDELSTDHPFRGVLGGLPADRTLRVRPEPLSEAAVAELATRAGRPAAGLHAITGGNPLLVTEMLAAGGPGVPTTVRDLVLARLAALSPQAQEVARFVAVIPTRVEPRVLAEAMRPDPAAVEECTVGGLLLPEDGAIGFRHELIRRAVEESLSPLRRMELNQRALKVLSGVPEVDLARLVHHARAAGDAVAVLRHAPPAAREAETAGAHREAGDHYRAALDHADRLPGTERAELLEGFAFNAYLGGSAEEALTARLAALEIWEAAGETLKVGENQRWLSRLYWWTGRQEEAKVAAARAITALEPGGATRELALAYSNQGDWYLLEGELAAAIEWSSRAIEVARQVGDKETLAHALTHIGTAQLQGGDEAGRATLDEAIEIAIGQGLRDHAVRAMVYTAFTSLEFCDYPRAWQDLERGISFALQHDLAGYAQYLMGMRALWRLHQGHWTDAERDARDVLAQPEQIGLTVAPALLALGLLRSRRGESGAAGLLQDGAERARANGVWQLVALSAAALAEDAWRCGEPDRATTEAAPVFELALRARHPWFTGELAWWLRLAGQRTDVPVWVAEPYRLMLAGDWRAAADAWERLGCPHAQAEALASGDDPAGWLRALKILDRLGAAPGARRLRRRLREEGEGPVPRGPRPLTAGNPAQLTARQVQVLTLLADRLSNAEIAQRLVLSVRTVDNHVAAILSKLSVHTRDQAVEAAQGLGIIPRANSAH